MLGLGSELLWNEGDTIFESSNFWPELEEEFLGLLFVPL